MYALKASQTKYSTAFNELRKHRHTCRPSCVKQASSWPYLSLILLTPTIITVNSSHQSLFSKNVLQHKNQYQRNIPLQHQYHAIFHNCIEIHNATTLAPHRVRDACSCSPNVHKGAGRDPGSSGAPAHSQPCVDGTSFCKQGQAASSRTASRCI